jgi:hypothetical protein
MILFRRNAEPMRAREMRALALAWLAALALALPAAAAAAAPADFGGEAASEDVRLVADWVVASHDHKGLPFIIVDKAGARLFLFDGGERIRGAAPVLLGLARGDDSPAGIGEKKLAAIRPEQRITPAGRFVAALGHNLSGQDILWVDYAAAISLHRVTDPKPGLTAGGRSARLASASALDNRISHGCINVSGAFFEQVVRPIFGAAGGIVYVLPETRPARALFSIPPRAGHARVDGHRSA